MDAFLQDFQGLADLIPYRIDGQIQFLSNLLLLESIAFAQDEYLTTLFRKAVDGSPETGLGLRAFLSVVIVDDSIGVVWFEGFGRDSFLAKMVKTTVSDHHI